MSTIYEILNRCLAIKEKLKLSAIVCVFDQIVYSMAVEIKWKMPKQYKDCTLMLGMFHMLMMYLDIIGIHFKDAGLRDVLIQSQILAEGSVDKTLTGKRYNRAVRSCKLMYEGLHRLLISKMETYCEDDQEKRPIITSAYEEIASFLDDISSETFSHLDVTESFRSYQNLLIQYKIPLSENGGLAKFGLSFLDMVELLLNTIYACRAGKWELLLECTRDVAAYAFAYDNFNYARYLTPFLGEMLNLEVDHPEIYNALVEGNFSVQLSDGNTFGRLEADKFIETTINQDTKTPGGTTGFSTNSNAINRWALNTSYGANLRCCFYKHLGYVDTKHKHHDLSASRMERDEKDVQSLIEVITNTIIDPLSDNDLLCISNGLTATEFISQDLQQAKRRGEEVLTAFVVDCLGNESEVSIYDPIKKLKLQTFSSLRKAVIVKCKDKTIPIKATRNLFGQISIIMQKRDLDLKEVFKYPLGPFPWALAGVMGDLKKTNKATLLHEVKKLTEPLDSLPEHYAAVFDGMAVVQKARASGLTFGELAYQMLQSILSSSRGSKRIDVVFDMYRENSIKNAKRLRRSTGKLTFRQLIRSYPVKQYNQFLSSSTDKRELIRFLVDQWKQEEHFMTVESGTFYVTCDEKCFQLSKEGVFEVPELESTPEEADTRMMLHVIHATNQLVHKRVIHTPDTDVVLIALSFSETVSSSLYVKAGTKNRMTIIDLNDVESSFATRYLTDRDHASRKEFLDALLGLHTFTGCNTVSAFAGHGKIRSLKLMAKSRAHVKLFFELVKSFQLLDELVNNLQEFVCKMYFKEIADTDLLRYKLYCSKKGKCEIERLPPCMAALRQHFLRANYQTRVWRLCREQTPTIPSPTDHDWVFDEDGIIGINWMDCQPAPDEVCMYSFNIITF